jgi:hypothetical protein
MQQSEDEEDAIEADMYNTQLSATEVPYHDSQEQRQAGFFVMDVKIRPESRRQWHFLFP